jgi:ATP-dependent DNA helicase RecQ
MKQQMKRSPDVPKAVGRIARAKLGYEHLRPGQEEAIAAVLAGHDTLAVMPTGSGKSAIYQIAGAIIPGVTVVVSPLIALQQDQVEAIAEMDAGGAALLNSALPAAEREEALDEFAQGATEFPFSGARTVCE